MLYSERELSTLDLTTNQLMIPTTLSRDLRNIGLTADPLIGLFKTLSFSKIILQCPTNRSISKKFNMSNYQFIWTSLLTDSGSDIWLTIQLECGTVKTKDTTLWQDCQTYNKLITQRLDCWLPTKWLETINSWSKLVQFKTSASMLMIWKESGHTYMFHASDKRRLFPSSNTDKQLLRDKNLLLLDNRWSFIWNTT